MKWPQSGGRLKYFIRLVAIGFAYFRGFGFTGVVSDPGYNYRWSIVPRHFELPQWQANFFFDSSVVGSSICSA
jgi:hypothetical protein